LEGYSLLHAFLMQHGPLPPASTKDTTSLNW